MRNMTAAVLLLIGFAANGQDLTNETKPRIEVARFTSQFLLSTDFSSLYFNFIGTGFKYTKGRTSISLSLFPAIRFHQDSNPDPAEARRPFISTGFAVGPLIQYKRLFIGFPAFYDSHDVHWRYAMGAGLKLGQ